MNKNFTHTTLGNTGLAVHRLGLSASYRPGKPTIFRALDEGLNFFFTYGFDGQMVGVMRDVLKTNREKYVIATGAYNLIFGHQDLRRTLDKRLMQLCTEYLDVFLFLGVMKEKQFPTQLLEELCGLKETGKVRYVGISTHDRKFAGRLADEGALDILMIRYNAAHRGAKKDIFPHLQPHNPGVVSYTATRWSYLLRRPRGWPKEEPVPTAGMAYRFVLSNPHVHVCISAPANLWQFEENLVALQQGPLTDEEMAFMRRFGDVERRRKKWFM